MKNGFFSIVAVLLLESGLALAQSCGSYPAAYPGPPSGYAPPYAVPVAFGYGPMRQARVPLYEPAYQTQTVPGYASVYASGSVPAPLSLPPAFGGVVPSGVPMPGTPLFADGSPAPTAQPAHLAPPAPPRETARHSPPTAVPVEAPPACPAEQCPAAPDCFKKVTLPVTCWVKADALGWWLKNSPLPPLVSTGAGGVLLGGSSGNNDPREGARLTAGSWLTMDRRLGVEGSGFYLFQRSNSISASPVSLPGLSGTASASQATRLWGGEASLRHELFRNEYFNVSLLGGFRYLDLHESLDVGGNSAFTSAAGIIGGTTIGSTNHFGTENHFYGGQIGTQAEYCLGRFSINLLAKVGLGDVNEVVDIASGSSVTSAPASAAAFPIGLLTLANTQGRSSRDSLALMSEAGFTVGYQFTRRLRGSLGYTFLYLNSVVRPGEQVAPVLTGPVPGGVRPAFAFKESDFWAQGVNAGLEFRF